MRRCAHVALTLVYSSPSPGTGSRYADLSEAHEARMLTAYEVADHLSTAGEKRIGEVLLEAVSEVGVTGASPDPRAVAYLAPVARARLIGFPLGRLLKGLGNEEIGPFSRAFGDAGVRDSLTQALEFAVAGDPAGETTLRDVMRFSAARDPLSRDYVSGYEIPRELGGVAILSSLSRYGSSRAAIVQAFLEVLSEVPDLDIASRAGAREAEEVSRMARGVLKAGGAHSRRGLQGITNLDGILREDRRLTPTATEPVIAAAAYMVCLDHGPDSLGSRLRPISSGR